MKSARKRKEKGEVENMATTEVNRTLVLAFALFVVINILVVVAVLQTNNEVVFDGIGKIVETAIREQPATTDVRETPSSSGEGTVTGKPDLHPIFFSGPIWDSFMIHYVNTKACANQIKNAIEDYPALSVDEELDDITNDEDYLGFWLVNVDTGLANKTQVEKAITNIGAENADCLSSSLYPNGKGSTTVGPIQNVGVNGKTILFADDDEDPDDDFLEEDEYVAKYSLSQSIPLIGADIVQAGYGTFAANNGTGAKVCIVDAKINGLVHDDSHFIVEYGVKEKKFGYQYVVAAAGDDTHAEYLVQTIAPKNATGLGVAPGVDLMIVSLSSLSKKSDLIKGFVNGCVKNKMGPNKSNLVFDVMVTGANIGEVGGTLYTTSAKVLKGKGNIKAVDKTFKKYSRSNYKKKENNNVSSSKYNPRTRPILVAAGQNFTTSEGVHNKLAALDSVIAVGAVADNSGIAYNPVFGTLSCSSDPLASNKSLCDSACSSLVDIAAPGFEIMVSSGDAISGGFGTSVAAAHAAGVVALMVAKPKPTPLTLTQITDNLKLSATNHATTFGQNPLCQGAGVINAPIAVGAS